MNKTYRLVWNDFINAWVAVSEITKARGKRSSKALLLSATAAVLSAPISAQTAPPPDALPTGGQVIAGQISISQSGATMNISQTTQRGVIDWGTFNVGSSATVNFIQPSSSAATLNRILDPNPSQIFGRINANGQVFLTNASGIYFGKSASVNVGALTATTHSIGNADFMAGNLNFTRNGATGKVENEGNLTAELGGHIALLAPEVRNNGVVIAQGGTVALAAGEAFELQFDGTRLANIRVEPATIAALVENGHAVQAPGGLIILSAQAANRLQGGVVNNTGSLEASGLVDNGGTIRLEASDKITHTGNINVDAAPGKVGAGGTALLIANLENSESLTHINGIISARGGDLGGMGGFVETSATHLSVSEGSRIMAGEWLLDPTNITVEAGGSTTDLGGSSIAASLIASTLDGGTGVTLHATNDITINQAISWTQSLFTLRAGNDVNIYATLTPSNTSALSIEYGYDNGTYGNGNTTVRYAPYTDTAFRGKVDFGARTGTGFLSINGNDYYVVNSIGGYTSGNGLSQVTNTNFDHLGAGRFTKDYVAIGSDLDAASWTNQYAIAYAIAAGRVVDGLGHTISNVTIATSPSQYTGVFGSVAGTLRNIGFSDINIGNTANMGYGAIGAIYAGGLVSGVKLSGTNTFSGQQLLGGLAGYNSGTLKEFSLTGSIQLNPTSATNGTAGGAVGQNEATGLLSYGYSNATVTTTQTSTKRYIGGFIGRNRGTASYLENAGTLKIPVDGAGDVIAFTDTVGTNYSGFGGIVGENGNHGSASTAKIANSTFSGTITAGANAGFVGGIVGYNHRLIESSTSSGSITVGNNASHIGGIAGANYDQWSANTPTIQDNVSFTGSISAGTGSTKLGGIAGYNASNGIITSFNSAGTLTAGSGSTYVGGIVGQDANTSSGISSGSSSTSVTVGGAEASVDKGTGSPFVGRLIGNGGTQAGTISYQQPVAYTLSALTGIYTYTGNAYLLADLWASAADIFGISYAAWAPGSDYEFKYNSNVITGFTNVGTYSNISISILKAGFTAASSGNTPGTFIIAEAANSPGTSTTPAVPPPPVLPPPQLPPVGPSPTDDQQTGDSTGSGGTSGPLIPGGLGGSGSGLSNANSSDIINLGGTGTEAGGSPAGTSTPTGQQASGTDQDASAGAGNGGISISLVKEASVGQNGIITVSVPKDMATSGTGFSFTLPAQVTEGAADRPIQVTTTAGDALPDWLRFNPETNTFVASAVPDGAFPIEVVVIVGSTRTTIIISERQEDKPS